MAKSHYFSLQPSEMAIFQAAANIYASYVATVQVTPENEVQLMKKAIQSAMAIARYVEEHVQSDDEMAPGAEK